MKLAPAKWSAQGIWWVTLAFKILIGCLLPLSFDEAYYWVWSHHPQLSYFDHPAMVSWLFSASHFLEPWQSAVRLPFIIIGHLASLIWLLILQELDFSEAQKKGWLILAITSPFLGFGSLLGVPDVPMLLFSSFAILFLLRALRTGKILDYFLLGASLGLGFCSKYHTVLVGLAMLLLLVSENLWRRISKFGFVLSILAGLVFCAPVVIWNAENNWGSFAFQLQHGLNQGSWHWDWTLGYIAGELLLLFPVVVWYALQAKTSGQQRWLQYFAWTPIVFFLISSLRGPVELNWPLTAWPAVYALAILGAKKFRPLWIGVAFWCALGSFFIIHIFFPFLKDPPDKLNEVHYFDPIKPLAGEVSPLYLGSYQMASVFSYEFKKDFSKLWLVSRHDFFDEIQKGPPQESHYFVAKEPWVPFPDWILNAESYRIEKLRDIPPKFELYEVFKK